MFDGIVLLIVLLAMGQVIHATFALLAELIDACWPEEWNWRFWSRVLEERDEREGRAP